MLARLLARLIHRVNQEYTELYGGKGAYIVVGLANGDEIGSDPPFEVGFRPPPKPKEKSDTWRVQRAGTPAKAASPSGATARGWGSST